jgi:hypothetical protein
MIKKYYKVKFLSDVVILSSNASQENKSLNYIPGANFLGIVAKRYTDIKKANLAYDIFHSGKVRFNDAHISINNRRSHKKPNAWFYLKSEKDKSDKKIFLHHYLKPEDHDSLLEKKKQLKQERQGFFIYNNSKITDIKINHNYSMKSAHNIKERRSAESKMYGYDSLPKGSEWIFYIESDIEDVLSKIGQILIGKHSIGKSRSAQYGRIEIKEIDYSENLNPKNSNNSNELLLYFDSPAAFIDQYGQPTYQPDIEKDLRLNSTSQINWEKSSVRIRSFSPYNGKRSNFDSDRVCIDKGSVLYIDNSSIAPEEYQKRIKSGIGMYRSEGLGNIIVNPTFLTNIKNQHLLDYSYKEDINIKDSISSNFDSVIQHKSDNRVLNFIKSKKIKSQNRHEILYSTNKFVDKNYNKFSKISKSQWGKIRQIALSYLDYDDMFEELFDDQNGFLKHGESQKIWENRTNILKQAIEKISQRTSKNNARQFVINLSSEMTKR